MPIVYQCDFMSEQNKITYLISNRNKTPADRSDNASKNSEEQSKSGSIQYDGSKATPPFGRRRLTEGEALKPHRHIYINQAL